MSKGKEEETERDKMRERRKRKAVAGDMVRPRTVAVFWTLGRKK